MRELKPCPFCGGKVHLETDLAQTKDPVFCFICDNCGALVYMDDLIDKNESIEAWNNRPSPWHTETPTEDGQYFVAYRWGLDNQIMHDMAKQICYGATVFSHGTWKVEFPFVVLAWQRIVPYKEED